MVDRKVLLQIREYYNQINEDIATLQATCPGEYENKRVLHIVRMRMIREKFPGVVTEEILHAIRARIL